MALDPGKSTTSNPLYVDADPVIHGKSAIDDCVTYPLDMVFYIYASSLQNLLIPRRFQSVSRGYKRDKEQEREERKLN